MLLGNICSFRLKELCFGLPSLARNTGEALYHELKYYIIEETFIPVKGFNLSFNPIPLASKLSPDF